MSVKVITWVFENSVSKGASRLVLLAMADEASNTGELSAYRRSQSWIASKANVSTRSVRSAIDDLVALGELTVLREGLGRHSADYQIVMGPETCASREERISAPPEAASAPSSRSVPTTPVVGEPRVRKAKHSSFPEPWVPGDAEREAATNAGMAPEHRREQWDQFRDHHTAKGSVMADWPAAWRTWCRNWRRFNLHLVATLATTPGDKHRHAGRIMYDGANNRVEIQDDGSHKIIATSEEVTAELNAADWNDLT